MTEPAPNLDSPEEIRRNLAEAISRTHAACDKLLQAIARLEAGEQPESLQELSELRVRLRRTTGAPRCALREDPSR